MKFYVIGITDHPQPFLPPEVVSIIKNGHLFSGGKRHHELMKSWLPDNAVWIDITVPLDAVFEKYHDEVVVFASGDPLFYGFANTIRRKMPEAEIILYPAFNSLQMLAHRLVMPYHDMRVVSLTGRPWREFDKALIERTAKIGVLTDHEHTPATIAQRMLDYGYANYEMSAGEHLGNPEKEKITTLSLEEAAKQTFSHPNCLIIYSKNPGHRPFGIPDSMFALLDGREKMITKMQIRLLSLQALHLWEKNVFWDIGFCTGSVSIEARLQFPHLHIEAFEIREEGRQLMETNSRRFGAPGIETHIGDFLQTDISSLHEPDAVFIGGHGGQLKAIMAKVLTKLTDNGCIVMNSVSASSRQLFDEACSELGLKAEQPIHISLNNYNPIDILTCKRPQ
jgi:precorrin-6Y C5,15-methyltransferase (decarboxylating)